MSSQSYNSTLVLRQGINIRDDSRETNKGNEAKVKSGSLGRALPLEDVSHRGVGRGFCVKAEIETLAKYRKSSIKHPLSNKPPPSSKPPPPFIGEES